MDALNYLLLVNIYLVLFYAFYALLLKNETFFKLNRIYLVGGACISFLIPFLQSEWIRSLFITRQVEEVTQNINFVFGGQPLAIQAEKKSWDAGEVILYVYLAGAVLCLLRFLWQLYKVQAILKSGQTEHAFSFFQKVKVGSTVPNRDTVYGHELVHARQWHSADVILFEIISIINWFNPVVYLYRKAIKHIHEFTADEIAANHEESKAAYAMLLLSQTFGISSYQLTNSFYNQSLLKRRIIMLHKSKSTQNALLKYGLSAPLFAAMMILSSASFKSDRVAEQISAVSTEALNLIQPQDSTGLTYEKFLENNSSVEAVEWRSYSRVTVLLKNGKKENYELSNPAELKTAQRLYGQFPGPPAPPPPLPVPNTPQARLDQVSLDMQDGPLFSTVEESPEFPGGMKAFYEYLSKSFKYPEEARKNQINGKVILQFVVERDGRLTDIKVLRGLGSGLDEEGVRVLSASPHWTPGIQNGKKVRVQYTLPFSVSTSGQKTGAIGYRIEDGKLVNNFPKDALLILDGKEVKQEELQDINPNSIKSVNVLKGETASGKYGQKGKDGVVEIYINDTPPNTAGTESKEINSTGLTIKDNKQAFNYKGLTIVDGVEITNTALQAVNPGSIESINVLKGESGIQKYGDRAKEGVMEIALKRK